MTTTRWRREGKRGGPDNILDGRWLVIRTAGRWSVYDRWSSTRLGVFQTKWRVRRHGPDRRDGRRVATVSVSLLLTDAVEKADALRTVLYQAADAADELCTLAGTQLGDHLGVLADLVGEIRFAVIDGEDAIAALATAVDAQ